jgi:hypothetical protein
VGLPLPLALGKKKYLRLKAIITHLGDVPHVAKQGKHGKTAIVPTATKMIATATDIDGKCFLRYALNAAEISEYHLNHAGTSQFTATIAIAGDIPYSML